MHVPVAFYQEEQPIHGMSTFSKVSQVARAFAEQPRVTEGQTADRCESKVQWRVAPPCWVLAPCRAMRG